MRKACSHRTYTGHRGNGTGDVWDLVVDNGNDGEWGKPGAIGHRNVEEGIAQPARFILINSNET